MGRPKEFRKWIGEVATGEWWFWNGRPNGGAVILYRAGQVSVCLWVTALVLRSIFSACPSCHLDWWALWPRAETVPWLGALFGAVYAALYARFAAQFGYLANTYNQLMATQAQIEGMATTDEARDPNSNKKIHLWKVGLVEDLDDLHLATKKMFSTVVYAILDDPILAPQFEDTVVDGAKGRKELLADVTKWMGGEEKVPAGVKGSTGVTASPSATTPSEAPLIAAVATGLVAAIVVWRWWR